MEGMNFVKEGDVQGLKSWLEEVQIKETVDEEDMAAAQRRSIAFGHGMFCLDMSLLLWAIDNQEISQENRLQLCELLLEKYPTLVNHPGPEHATPLHYSSGNQDSLIVSLLLQKKANITLDDKNETPLHWACLNGGAEVIKLLLKHGANPNDLSLDKKTGLHYAVINKHEECIAILLSDPRLETKYKNEAREMAIKLQDSSIMRLFDPEKRQIIVTAQDQQRALNELKAKLQSYEQKSDADLKAIQIAEQKLIQEREEHLNSTKILEELMEEVRVRSQSEEQQRTIALKEELESLKNQNKQLEEQIDLLSSNVPSADPIEGKEKIEIAETTIKNVINLMKATQSAMTNSAVELENIFTYFPNNPSSTSHFN